MNRICMFIMSFFVALCAGELCAQSKLKQRISIEEMFTLADQNSKSLRTRQSGIETARQSVNMAKIARLPEINMALSFSYLGDGYLTDRNFSNGNKAAIPSLGNNFSFEVSQVIYAGGALSNTIALQKLVEESAQLEYSSFRENLRFLLISNYLDLFRQQAISHIYEQHIAQTELIIKDMRAKVAEGVVLKNDITRYELLLSNLQLTNLQIQNTIEILNENLVIVLGLDRNTMIEIDNTIFSEILPVESKETWHNLAMRNASSVRQTALAIRVQECQDKLIRSNRLPQIMFVAADYLNGPITIEIPSINKNFNYWYAGIGISYNISSLYKTKQEIKKSQWEIQQMKEKHEEVKEEIELAVNEDYIRYLESWQSLIAQEKSLELAIQNYEVITHRYKNEMALITDLLDATTSKLNAELQLTIAQSNIIYQYYKLKKTAGDI